MVFRHSLATLTSSSVSNSWKETFWPLQFSPASIWYLVIAFVVPIIVWTILFRYRERGMDLLRLLKKGKITELSGLGSWYANNITRIATSMLYSMAHYGLVPLLFWFTVLMLAPLNFPALLDATWVALPFFLAIGCVDGIDNRYRWLGIVDPNANDEGDGS